MKLTQKIPTATQRVLVYGGPKSGKTQLVGTLASKYKLIWFDLENGYATLLKLPQACQENIELISIPDSRTFPIAVDTMLKVMKSRGPVTICEEHGKVSCPLCANKIDAHKVTVDLTTIQYPFPSDTIVVVDSLTQLTNSAIALITKNQPDDYKMDFDDWGNLKAVVEKFLSEVQAARYNIVCITHEEEVEMEDKRKKIVPTCGSSKSSRNTAKYFDHVVYCDVKNKKHMVASATTFSNTILTGSRTDVDLEKSQAADLFQIFSGKVSEAADIKNSTAPSTRPTPTPGATALSSLKATLAASTTGAKKS